VCTPDNPCNPAGSCGKCAADSFFCQGAALLRCNSGGVFEKVQDCASAALCNLATGSCDAPECKAEGVAVCDAVQGLRICQADLTWGPYELCDTSALCNAADGRCEQPLCEYGATRCNHGSPERCKPDRTGWEPTATCSAGTDCDLATGSCQPAGCSEGSFRCNDVFLEQCSSGAWTRLARCVSHTLCKDDAGRCDPPQCMPGQFKCEGPDLWRCHDNGTWGQLDTCGEGTTCDAMSGACK
jgi:hypothetical protein